jgi:hypothetical protein
VLDSDTRRHAFRSSARCSVRAAWGKRRLSLFDVSLLIGYGLCGAPVPAAVKEVGRSLLEFDPCF